MTQGTQRHRGVDGHWPVAVARIKGVRTCTLGNTTCVQTTSDTNQSCAQEASQRQGAATDVTSARHCCDGPADDALKNAA
jgi:hypothetical protein